MPGTPDIVLKGRSAVILVHGCYWHGHGCRRGGTGAKSNTRFWKAKIAKNKLRDAKAVSELEKQGWSVFVVWECEINDLPSLTNRLLVLLGHKLASPRALSSADCLERGGAKRKRAGLGRA
jgi:DNA mismatch endonuclease (patch repair protein)